MAVELGGLDLGLGGGGWFSWAGFPTCSPHGSHNTTFLLNVPRATPGVFRFGPSDVAPGEFHPLSSVYLEPLLFLALPGALVWLGLMLTLSCFCYRRYRLGRCGEPFPTVRGYPPREVALTMLVALSACVLLIVAGGIAYLAASAAYSAAMGVSKPHRPAPSPCSTGEAQAQPPPPPSLPQGLIEAGGKIEDLLSSSFSIGRALLDTALDIVDALHLFDQVRVRVVRGSSPKDLSYWWT